MVAFPTEWVRSGIMTFIVSHNGRACEKKILVKDAAAIGAKIPGLGSGAGCKEVMP